MANPNELREPWLIAVWPGMGNVAVGAGAFLAEQIGAHLVHELPARDLFDIKHVEVKQGLARVARLPRSMFFEWSNPAEDGHDLLIFIGEAQPSTGGYSLCQRLLDYALARGVRRIITFAAMATQLHPTDDPRVFGVATDNDTLQELRDLDTEVLAEGQIGGLNGVLLAAGVERGRSGLCLMGELPFFAAAVPNPKASLAVLRVFARLAKIDIDTSRLEEQSKAVEQGLLELLEKMKEAARQQSESDEEGFSIPEFAQPSDDEPEPEADKTPKLDYATRRRIESMFEDAARNREKAFQLKEELDRLGVFKHYEDRFLDLFKKAE